MAFSKKTVTQNFPTAGNYHHQAGASGEDIAVRNPTEMDIYVITTMTDVPPSNEDMKYGDVAKSRETLPMQLLANEYVWMAHGVGGDTVTVSLLF